jgi:hypothetical protein
VATASPERPAENPKREQPESSLVLAIVRVQWLMESVNQRGSSRFSWVQGFVWDGTKGRVAMLLQAVWLRWR